MAETVNKFLLHKDESRLGTLHKAGYWDFRFQGVRFYLAMVYLALEPRAATEAIRVAADAGWFVWVGADAVKDEEHKSRCRSGAKLTRFSYPLENASFDVIEEALVTIAEHHPGEIIWVQHAWVESNA